MEKLAKRIRSRNKQYFDAGVDAGTQKACDLLLVAAYECGFVRTKRTAYCNGDGTNAGNATR